MIDDIDSYYEDWRESTIKILDERERRSKSLTFKIWPSAVIYYHKNIRVPREAAEYESAVKHLRKIKEEYEADR